MIDMANAKKGGRPRRTGKRHPGGQLVRTPANDKGNDVVQARSSTFAVFQGGKADQQVSDPIGRLWAVGLLDGQRHDGAILRDIGRRYGALYWHEYTWLSPRVSELEPRSRGSGSTSDIDRAGEQFKRLDDLARSTGQHAVAALHDLCVNSWWFPDVGPEWLDRLVTAALIRKQAERVDAGKAPLGSIVGPLPVCGDHARLALAISGLVAMVEG
jgi:hypothetical protein